MQGVIKTEMRELGRDGKDILLKSLQANPFRNGTQFSSVQFSLVAQSCMTLCDPKDSSTLGLPVHHQHPEFTQTHVH